MASFIQTCFKMTSKGKSNYAKQKSPQFSKSISDPALNLIIINKAGSKQREKSFSVSEDLALKLHAVEVEDDGPQVNPDPDLVAQDGLNDEEGQNLENDEMSSSFFDNNGNPVDDDEELEPGGEREHVDAAEPIYFINAATLSEDEEFPSLPPGEPIPRPRAENLHFQYDGYENNDTHSAVSRPRVPISKSFPDIIQTTMADVQQLKDYCCNNSNSGAASRKFSTVLPRDTSGIESLAADSLEDLPVVSAEKRNSLSVFNRSSAPSETDFALTESFASVGITGEKPPESWVIDFNSLSLENLESGANNEKVTKSSNQNSLSFFVKMDDPQTTDDSLSESLSMSSERKKIFSMFVDINEKEGKPSNSGSAMNKSIRNIGEGSGSGRSSISGHSQSAKYQPCCSQNVNRGSENTAIKNPIPNPRTPKPINTKDTIHVHCGGANVSESPLHRQGSDLGSASNRSSLHVPNETENSFVASSLLSSMETAAMQEEMEICQGGPCFKLGMDLLRMFQEGINTDVNINVRGRWVRAHKCILASRSQYFAAILSGNWIEKAGNTINLDEFTYAVVQFTMYHIYSGTNEIPDTIDLIELATLTDLLGLEGLREVISQTIRTKFCHNFHRPCTGCISGILECFPIALNYGMEDLHRKMTKWICKHFVRVWPTKAFANLGDDLIEKCLTYSVNHLSPENLLDITLGCDQLLSTMPTVRWTEPIFSVVNQLSDSCVQYVGENLSQVLQSQRFILFGKGQSWNISRIEGTFQGGILLLKPDEACLSHVALSRLVELGTETIDEVEWSTSFVDFLKAIRREVEKYIMANASRSVLSKNWEYLGQDVRKRICSTSFLGMDKHGNKIQKATPNKSAQQSKAGNTATLTLSTKGRPLSSGSTSGSTRRPSTATRAPEPILTPVESRREMDMPSPADSRQKSVASVRPMPSSQVQRQNVFTERKVTTTRGHVGSSGSPMAARMPNQIEPSQVTALRSRQREKSFDSSSRTTSSSSTLSRGHAGSQAQIPMTPSRTNSQQFPPMTGKTCRGAAGLGQKQPANVPQQPPAQKPQFLTNSEKAKAVSKPQIQLRGSRSNSVSAGTGGMNSAYCRQSSLGSTASASVAVPATASAAPRTPNLSQPSRYAKNSERVVKPSSPLPTPRAQVRQMRATTTTTSNVRKTGNIQSTRSNLGIKSTVGPTGAVKNTAAARRADIENTSHGHGGRGTLSEFAIGSNGSSTEGLMTKSSIEMETSGSGGEPKMRTLAEIGRSSTFSKDEPTILGKMDISLDFGYNNQF